MKLIFKISFLATLLFSFADAFSQNTEGNIISIENEFLKVSISKEGAELKSIKNLNTHSEILWQADPDYWPQTSPVLFPFIGKSWNDEYSYKGRVYPMKIHGFASQKNFLPTQVAQTEAWFLLKGDEETLKIYPFKFELMVGYILHQNQLEIQWKVENKDTQEMFFQLGGHTGFQLPDFDANGEIMGYVQLKSDKKPVQYIVKEAGRYFTEIPTIHDFKPNKDGLFPLTKEFFKDDAVVFENQANEIVLFSKNKEPLVKVKLKTPVFALWTAKQFAPFVCIEPWYGRADTENFKGDISQKKWIQHLLPQQIFSSGYSIEVFQ